MRGGGSARRPHGSAHGRRGRRGVLPAELTQLVRPDWPGTLLEPVLRRLDVPQIADLVAGVYVRQAAPRRSGHVRADSGDAQGNRLSNVRNLVICSECWRDTKIGYGRCQRGELERLQKEVGDRFRSPIEQRGRGLREVMGRHALPRHVPPRAGATSDTAPREGTDGRAADPAAAIAES